jgi:Helix-turn-helix domain
MDTTAGTAIEPFVDADRAADFLVITRRRVLEMSRDGEIPAHPIGHGRRKQWRYRLSELADALVAKSSTAKSGSTVSSTSAVPGNRIGGNR